MQEDHFTKFHKSVNHTCSMKANLLLAIESSDQLFLCYNGALI